MRILIFLLVAAMSMSELGATLPPYVKACDSKKYSWGQCIENTIRAVVPKLVEGIPEMGITPLDPVTLGTIDIDNPALNLQFTNAVLTGLRGLHLNYFKLNEDKNMGTIDFTANVTLKADYTMDGQVLVLPIKGHGESKVKLTNLKITIIHELGTLNDLAQIGDYKENFKLDRAHFKFTNLFGGNKELADVTLQFLNDNWNDIIYEIAPPAVHQIIAHCLKNLKNFLNKIPVSELYVDM